MHRLIDRLAAAPRPVDRAAARRRVEDLVREAGDDPRAGVLREGLFRDLLVGLAGHAPFLWELARRDVPRLLDLAHAVPEEAHAGIVVRQRAAGSDPGGPEGAMRALRRGRAAHALLVALADLGGAWALEQVVGALSDFADASVRAAVEVALAEAATARKFLPPDPADLQAGSGLVVLALGKHGAGELNYSSDVDLVVFFAPAAPLAPGVEATPFFTRLAQRIARLLQERTAEGYVHRVDYRLRPDPGSTPTAISLDSAYSYYESLGQNWERAAYIKARAVAGDVAAGERFLAALTPFVWRKFFDFAAIRDVHAMKRQIRAVRDTGGGLAAQALPGHDVKLGRGGIREVEFFVQTQQLVFGGRRPGLRGRQTLAMLAALADERWITGKARDELGAAYRFHRTLEHRLQMLRDEQTQRLPADPPSLKAFARFCGFTGLRAFEAAILGHARRVQAHDALLFEAGADLSAEAGSLVFTGSDDDPETVATLGRLGFGDPAGAAETVRGWHFGRRPAVTSPRAREVLTELTPALLAALGGTAAPDAALAALDRAFGRMPAAIELMTVLQSHERLRLLFADILGTAPRLAEAVAFSPHVLDAVIDPAFGDPVTDEAAVEAQARRLVGTPAGFEDFLDRLRDAGRLLRFLTGARLLSGVVDAARAGAAYAAVARAVVRLALEAVAAEFAAAHGRVPGSGIAVVALGRLGARQLTADSDLDLVVLYEFDEARRESDGARPLDAALYHNRLAQRLVAALTAPTRRGRLYEVDLRLRPQGGKGPVASRLSGFLAYEAGEAETWEHMALTRARVIAGDLEVARAAEAGIAAVVGRPRDPALVAREVLAMRALVAEAKPASGPWDLKQAPGGLTDIDFLAQWLVLGQASRHPDLAGRGTAAALEIAGARGLLPPDDARRLLEAHALLDTVHHWQRLMTEGDFAAAPAPLRARIAAVTGQPGEPQLLAALAGARAEVRAVSGRYLKARARPG